MVACLLDGEWVIILLLLFVLLLKYCGLPFTLLYFASFIISPLHYHRLLCLLRTALNSDCIWIVNKILCCEKYVRPPSTSSSGALLYKYPFISV